MTPALVVPGYFAVRIGLALLLLKRSASVLSVADFAILSQLLAFGALLNLVSIGGTQNGLIRQAAIGGGADTVTRRAAFLIWAWFAPGLLVAILIGRGALSMLLSGGAQFGGTVAIVAALVLAAGPGQIWCSLLSGQRRTIASLGAQTAGLATGSALALWRIAARDPGGAAIGFAGGGWVTMVIAFALTRRASVAAPRRAIQREATALLRYSGALAATTGASSLLLFALRSVYRADFGASNLGYWLVANRISDLSTQLIGLVMIQLYVPGLAAIVEGGARRRMTLRFWAVGTGAMATALTLFWLLARPLVHVFLSDAFLPAIPVIGTYMVGDLCRVWVSLAMYDAFARGRPLRYVGIEIGTMAMFAGITLLLVLLGDRAAPQIGYASAYAITALVVTVAFFSAPAPAAARTVATA